MTTTTKTSITNEVRTVQCPIDDPDGNDVVGCGHVFTATPDDEGLFDCPKCGMWFDPNHPNSSRSTMRATRTRCDDRT